MIWTLVRRSPALRFAPWVALIHVAGWLSPSHGDHTAIMVSAPGVVYMGYRVVMGVAPETSLRCTFFDAALPIEGRDLWVSKMIVLLGVVWLPVLATSALLAVIHYPALPFLNAAAGGTAILLAAQSIRIREFHEPPLFRNVLLVAGGAVMIAIAVSLPQFASRVLAGYLLANVVFFLLAWARVPKSFEAAPANPQITAVAKSNRVAGATANSSPMRVWWKIMQPIYLTYLVLVAMVWFVGGGASLCGIIMIVILVSVRSNWNFLGFLPVSPRKLFWATWAPLPFAMLLGHAAAVHFSIGLARRVPLGPNITAIDWAINVALLFGWILGFQLPVWHRTRRWPAVLKAVIIAAVPTAVLIAILADALWRRYGVDPIPYFAVKCAAILPQNPALLAILLLVPLAALYLLVERSFCEMEYSQTRTIGESYLQGR